MSYLNFKQKKEAVINNSLSVDKIDENDHYHEMSRICYKDSSGNNPFDINGIITIYVPASYLKKDTYDILRNNCTQLLIELEVKEIYGEFTLSAYKYDVIPNKSYIDWNFFKIKSNFSQKAIIVDFSNFKLINFYMYDEKKYMYKEDNDDDKNNPFIVW